MPELPIVPVGESAGVVLPREVLESLGLRVGDRVTATVGDHEVILRPVDDARRTLVEQVTNDIFQQRADAYERLA